MVKSKVNGYVKGQIKGQCLYYRVLCETVKDFIVKVGIEANDEKDGANSMSHKCEVLNQKLDALLNTLEIESQASEPSQVSG